VTVSRSLGSVLGGTLRLRLTHRAPDAWHAIPPDPRVTDRLAHARRQQQLARSDTLAVQAAAEDRWGDAVEALEQITAVDPGYRDAGSRLQTARVQRRIAVEEGAVKVASERALWCRDLRAVPRT
jgi:hypothetical protein